MRIVYVLDNLCVFGGHTRVVVAKASLYRSWATIREIHDVSKPKTPRLAVGNMG